MKITDFIDILYKIKRLKVNKENYFKYRIESESDPFNYYEEIYGLPDATLSKNEIKRYLWHISKFPDIDKQDLTSLFDPLF